MREIALTFIFSLLPYLIDMLLYSAKSLFFRYTSIRNTVKTLLQQFKLFLRCEIPVIWHTLIMSMSYKVHNIFFKISTCTAYDSNFILAYHFCK